MKQSYIVVCIMGALSLFHIIVFPMEKLIEWFQDTEKQAKAYEISGNRQAFSYYGQLTDKPIPLYEKSPDPYKIAREIQGEAYNKILYEAQKFIREKNYKEALTILNLAPITFTNLIKSAQEAEELQNEEALYESAEKLYTSAIESEEAGDIKRALRWYGMLTDELVDLSALKNEEFRDKLRVMQDEAAIKIYQKALVLVDKKQYKEALEVYQNAPKKFHRFIQELNDLIFQRAQELANTNEYEEAYALLKTIESSPETEKVRTKIEQQQKKWIEQKLKAAKQPKIEPEKLQQELKDKLVLLVDKLRFIVKYISTMKK